MGVHMGRGQSTAPPPWLNDATLHFHIFVLKISIIQDCKCLLDQVSPLPLKFSLSVPMGTATQLSAAITTEKDQIIHWLRAF
jgi:hypothetical protein